MNEALELWDKPATDGNVMIAGWEQWADAGNVSSGLPGYLVELVGATRIGQIKPSGFYLFQVPGTHHFLRPEVTLEDGYIQSMETRKNEFHYAELNGQGLVIFLGDEPHMDAERYVDAIIDASEALGVRRVAVLGGVYGAMPYDKDRDVSCTYSQSHLKDELEQYAVRFSDYSGGTTIGTYLVNRARERGIEMIGFYAFVPAYDFSELSEFVQGMRIDSDFRAWYELMRRLNHMFDLEIDLSDLAERSRDLNQSMRAKIEQLDHQMPHLKVKSFMEKINDEFTEHPFAPLDDLWREELSDLLEDLDDFEL